MDHVLAFFRRLWSLAGHISLAQWLASLAGGSLMGTLVWIAQQPLWIACFVSLGAMALVSIVWSRTLPSAETIRSNLGGDEVVDNPSHNTFVNAEPGPLANGSHNTVVRTGDPTGNIRLEGGTAIGSHAHANATSVAIGSPAGARQGIR